MDGDMVPVLQIGFSGFDEFDFLFGIIDERAQFSLFFVADVAGKEFAHLTLDISRCVFQNMLESLALTV